MKEFWNTRYQERDYAYGTEPNRFFETEIRKIPIGKALFPAEGEGRNAVFAASLGWGVVAFDLSEAGKTKALKLADARGVSITYEVATLQEFEAEKEGFDALVLVFAHFPNPLRKTFHQKLITFLKPGGIVILVGFSKKHAAFNSVNEQAGGPKDPAMLFSKQELEGDFDGFDIQLLEEAEVDLQEGNYHLGKSAVIRLVARKK
ncbi:MAG: class I SAM-dependent methyltransferase [Algoriphagus sp.]|nr:class I SAM-dependent methyltransferase [Algoriphagus sp.]